ncbi:hypothetical protein JN531_012350 [Flagellatimonas centrodinii]|uniref:hypothetical protein n=1 Tax=Flagellatimonas centrodinii TaxID=2806210 RepID=UPI001FEF9604|nr:hypothetical protein [Flagellatimonas centrodinii]ULQ45891.1 hypothetical protein JN531_012350 [Flagellatimonas centrodinii]
MIPFTSGPFTYAPASRGGVINGIPSRSWSVSYSAAEIASRALPDSSAQYDIIEALADCVAKWTQSAAAEHAPDRIDLIDAETGDAIAAICSDKMLGMTPGLIDDRSRYWLRSKDLRYSRAVTLTQFAEIAAEGIAPALSWVAGLLPDEILSDDPSNWRPPTSWELRHVVGEGSLTRVSGARAAALVGVTPQNFRKYTARDGASTRQSMSFAMWHLLLHKLGVKNARASA